MKTVGISVDHYKLKIFEKELTKAGYDFRVYGEGKTVPFATIKVQVEDSKVFNEFKSLVEKMNKQASN